MENNTLIATALNNHIRIYLANTKEVVEKARIIHDLWPTSCAALGRTISMTGLLALRQKDINEEVTVLINGGGLIGNIFCIANNLGDVRGYCGNPHLYKKYEGSNKLAVGRIVGIDGYLSVNKNLKLKQNYISKVKLQTGEIGDDFAYFLSTSEQIPSIVSLGVLIDTDCTVKSAGALLIELLPNHTKEDIKFLENLRLMSISSSLLEYGNNKNYLKSIFNDVIVLEEKNIEYKCSCNKNRFKEKLYALPLDDLNDLMNDEEVEIKCEFCNKKYYYDVDELKEIINNVQNKRQNN